MDLFYRRLGRILFGATCVVLGGFWIGGGGVLWPGIVMLVVGTAAVIYGMGWW